MTIPDVQRRTRFAGCTGLAGWILLGFVGAAPTWTLWRRHPGLLG